MKMPDSSSQIFASYNLITLYIIVEMSGPGSDDVSNDPEAA